MIFLYIKPFGRKHFRGKLLPKPFVTDLTASRYRQELFRTALGVSD